MRVLALLAISTAVYADNWTAFRAAPFETVTSTNKNQAREVLNQFEQVRWFVGQWTGKTEAKTLWPVRVVITKSPTTPELKLVRDAWTANLRSGDAVPTQWKAQVTKLLLDAGVPPMPPEIDTAIVTTLAGLTAQGPRASVPATGGLNRILSDDLLRGRLRVFLSNLQNGTAIDVAARNAFEKTLGEINSGPAPTESIALSGKPVSPQKDYAAIDLDSGVGDSHAAEALGRCAASNPATSNECAGLTIGDKKALEAAANGGSKNARVYYALKEFAKASELKPEWPDPHLALAEREMDADRRAFYLQKATAAAPRDVNAWTQLAGALTRSNKFPEAAKAWTAAERAAPDDAARDRMRRERAAIAGQRAEYEAAEKRRIAEEKRQDLDRLKAEALAGIRAAEQRANTKAGPLDPKAEVVPWWDGPEGANKITGTLKRIDCLKSGLRLAVADAKGKLQQFLVPDPSKILFNGGKTASLTCGPQRAGRKITVDFLPKPDRKLATIGEAVSIELAP